MTQAIPTIPQLPRPEPPANPHRLHQVHGHFARVDTRRDLADTGASVSATGQLEILHHFTSHTPYEIMGYDGTVTRAAGQGTAYVHASDQDSLEEMFFVYIPSVDGTIISLEHHTRTHPDIHKWTQEAIPSSDTGCVTFRDVNDEVVSRYKTKQDKGLYYIQDLDFYPVPPSTIANMTHDDDADTYHNAPTVKCRTPRTKSLNCVDFEEDLGKAMIRAHMVPTLHLADPRPQFVIATLTDHQTTNLEKHILNFETWHHRLAHCSEKRLRQTQKLVDGIAAFHGPKLPALVNCRTCDVAKLRKAPRGPSMEDHEQLSNGQVFQMDVSALFEDLKT